MDQPERFGGDPGESARSEEVSETGKPTDETGRPTWLEDVDEPPRRSASELDVPEPSDEDFPGADEEPIDPEGGPASA